MKNAAFLTGSRRYGRPKLASDWDIVVLVSPEDKAWFEDHELHRQGILNLIFVTSEAEYEAWRQTTNLLERMKPVTREKAVEVTRYHKRQLGLIGDDRRGDYR